MTNEDRDLFAVREKKPNMKKRKKLKDGNPKKKILKKDKKKKSALALPLFEPLTYQSIKEGQVIFGCIREVTEFELVISLPHRIVGYAPITNISKAYTKLLSKVANEEEIDETVYALSDLYSPGQYVTTQVKKLTQINNKTKVILTLEPKYVNADMKGHPLQEGLLIHCAFKSTEDNGYALETGLPSVQGAFLPHSEALPNIGIGSTFLCRILSATDAEGQFSLKMTSLFDQNDSLYEENGKSYLPLAGDIIHATIKKVIPDGLLLNVNGLQGVVDNLHLPKPCQDKSDFIPGQEVRGRILYTTLLTRVVYLSLNKIICEKKKAKKLGFNIGDIIDEASVYKSSKSGVYFKLPHKNFGFCSSNHVKDGTFILSSIKKDLPIGDVTQCRVLQFSLIDQLYIVTLRKSLIKEKVLGMQNLEVGQILSVVIKEHIPAGALVAVSQHLDGFVPRLHLTDSNMSNPELKLPVGKSVNARILRVEPGKQLHFTLKSILVQSELPILKDVRSDLIGTHVEGTVVKISIKGLLIEFYNGLKGFVPKKNIPVDTFDDLNHAFKLGQVIKSQILKIYEDDGIMLSLIDFKSWREKVREDQNKKRESVEESLKAKDKKINPKIGLIFDCTVTNVDIEHQVIHLQSKGLSGNIEIPFYHLSDSPALGLSLFITLKKGDRLEGIMIFKILKGKVIATLKHSILQWAQKRRQNSQRVSSLDKGDIVPCIVVNVQNSKLDLHAPIGKFGSWYPLYKEQIAALASSAELSDFHFEKGQTIVVKCLRTKSKVLISGKFKDVMVSPQESSFQYLLNYLHELTMIKEGFLSKGGLHRQLAEFSFGDTVKIEVKRVLSFGALGFVRGTKIKAIVHGRYLSKEVSIGGELKAKVLFINYVEKCLELSLEEVSKKLTCSSSHDLAIEDTGRAVVKLIRPEFVLAKMLKGNNGQIVFLPSKRHLNDFRTISDCYVLDHIYKIVVKYVDGDIVLADVVGKATNKAPVELSSVHPILKFDPSNHALANDEYKGDFSSEFIKSLAPKRKKLIPISKWSKLPQFLRKPLKRKDSVKGKHEEGLEKTALKLKKESGFVWETENMLEAAPSSEEKVSDSEDESETEDSSKETENSIKDMMKKDPEDVAVWIKCLKFYFQNNRSDDARKTFDRALSKLPKNKTITLIGTFAKMEYIYGEPENAIPVYESLVNNFPKKLELWEDYFNILKEHNKIDSARNVLERMSEVKLPLHDKRSIFLKMQEFESKHGTPDSLDAVKRRAASYIASLV